MFTFSEEASLPALTLAPWARTHGSGAGTPGPQPARANGSALSIQFSRAIGAQLHAPSRGFSIQNIDLQAFRELASPVTSFDEYRVSTPVCGPHPHAGFATLNYVLEDSHGSLRSRDSLGNDLVTQPGGVVWTQAGSGMVHEELPADAGREVHGVQINVNLGSKNKMIAPGVLHAAPEMVPQWRNQTGDRLRVVVGSFAGLSSPIAPVEPFTLFDIWLRSAVLFELQPANNAIVYVLSGSAHIVANGHARRLEARHAIAFQSVRESAFVQLIGRAQLLVLSGKQLREPMVSDGPFIMNYPWQIDAAFARFHAGEMGRLEPVPQAYRGGGGFP